MKAMILAAGLGTRLRPLTDDRPKALVEVAGRTLLEIALSRLRAFGVREVIINVHHFADMILDYLKANDNFGMRIEVSREEVLLDTGGGLKKAAWFFLEDSNRLEEPFILHNVDVISTIDLRRMVQFHTETSGSRHPGGAGPGDFPIPALRRAASALRPAIRARSENLNWFDLRTGRVQALAFSGIHVISPRLLGDDDGRRRFLHHQLLSAARRPRRKNRRLSTPMNIIGAISAPRTA